MIDPLDPGYRFTLLGDMRPHHGNVVFLVEGPDWTRVLKVYRRRGSAASEVLRSVSHRIFEGKTGATARARRDTEQQLLELWERHGVDVPGVFDEPAPRGMGPATLWMEHCPGPTLLAVVAGTGRGADEKDAWIGRAAEAAGARYAAALREHEPRLCFEHPTWNHLLVSGERLVHLDLEVGYRRGFDPLLAVGLDLAGSLRSLERHTGEGFDRALAVYLARFPDHGLLARAAQRVLRGGDPGALLRRLRDRRARGPRGKTWVLGRVLDMLDGPRTAPAR